MRLFLILLLCGCASEPPATVGPVSPYVTDVQAKSCALVGLRFGWCEVR